MRIFAILIILACTGYLPYREPIPTFFNWDYETEIARQAHVYHGISESIWPFLGEAYFIRGGKRCNLLSTIKKWKVIL